MCGWERYCARNRELSQLMGSNGWGGRRRREKESALAGWKPGQKLDFLTIVKIQSPRWAYPSTLFLPGRRDRPTLPIEQYAARAILILREGSVQAMHISIPPRLQARKSLNRFPRLHPSPPLLPIPYPSIPLHLPPLLLLHPCSRQLLAVLPLF